MQRDHGIGGCQFRVPFTGPRCTAAHLHGWLHLPGRAWLQGLAQLHIVDFNHVAIQAGLLVEVDLAEGRGNLRGDIVLPEMLDPVLCRPCGDNGLVGPEVWGHMARRPQCVQTGHFGLAELTERCGHPW
ncbi:hypothetical protein D3C87_1560220 [compost metagenome]